MEALIQSMQDNVINGQRAEVETLVHQALEAQIPPDEILNTGLIAAM
ncbi:MAG: B12-binding domain-containing protein, partial [Anaerolineales bacterium]